MSIKSVLESTGSQKVAGSNPASSTKKAITANPTSNNLSTSPNSYNQLAIPIEHLIEGFLLSCKVENKSPATISFYKNILEKFQLTVLFRSASIHRISRYTVIGGHNENCRSY